MLDFLSVDNAKLIGEVNRLDNRKDNRDYRESQKQMVHNDYLPLVVIFGRIKPRRYR